AERRRRRPYAWREASGRHRRAQRKRRRVPIDLAPSEGSLSPSSPRKTLPGRAERSDWRRSLYSNPSLSLLLNNELYTNSRPCVALIAAVGLTASPARTAVLDVLGRDLHRFQELPEARRVLLTPSALRHPRLPPRISHHEPALCAPRLEARRLPRRPRRLRP